MDLTKEQMRTVDLLVAKLVMGYPFYDDDEIKAALERAPSPDDDSGVSSSRHLLSAKDAALLQRAPPFCREKSLALSVVDRLAEDGLTITMSRRKTDWTVKIVDDYEKLLGQATSKHLGTSICLAALRAIGVKV